MARQLRCEFVGAWLHVMSRGFQRQTIFHEDADRIHFLKLLDEMTERYNVLIHAYALMPNHYHLLIQTPDANAARALHWLNTSYGVWFNARHRRSGALFQSRYKSVLVEGDGEWAVSCSAYIHLNPVRVRELGLDKAGRALENAGFVPANGNDLLSARLERLRGYVWSSYRAYAGLSAAPRWLTLATLFSRMGSNQPHLSYRTYMETRLGADDLDDEPALDTPVFGSPEFQRKSRALRLSTLPSSGNALPWKRLLRFSTIIQSVEQLKNEPWDSFVGRHGDCGRDFALYAGRHYCGMTLRELGDAVGIAPAAVGQSLARLNRKLDTDPVLREQLEKLKQIINKENEK